MLSTLLSAGLSLAGGLLGKSSADSARDQTYNLAQQNMAMQREFAQNGIQWRVDDAKKAGIHPIYALGGPGASFSPVSASFTGDTSLPNALAATGQDVSRAISATRTETDKVDAFTRTARALSLEKAGLENDILRAELASKTGRLRQAAGPPFPAAADPYLIPGQTQSGLVQAKPLEVTPAPSNQPSSEGGAVSDVGYARTKTGWAPVPSKDVKERIEDQIIPELMWSWRNNVMPTFGTNQTPPPFPAPAGKEWYFDPVRQEYQLQDPNRKWWDRFIKIERIK